MKPRLNLNRPSKDSDSGPALASGVEPSWRRKAPKLAVEGAEEIVDTAPQTQIVIKTAKNSAKTIAVIATAVVAVGLMLWSIVGLTIFPTPEVDGKRWVVHWAAWPQAQAPAGATAFVSPKPVSNNILFRINLQFRKDPDNAIVTLLGGPVGTVSTDESLQIYIDGKPTGTRAALPIQKTVLNDEYAAVCIRGGCGGAGNFLTVADNRIVGEVRGDFKLKGNSESPLG